MINPSIGGDGENYFKNIKATAEQLKTILAQKLAAQTDDFVGEMTRKQLSGRGAGDMFLNVRTGHLRQSWFSTTIVNGDSITASIDFGGDIAPYGRIHQYGGVIHQMARSGLHGQARKSGGKNSGRFVKHGNFQSKRVFSQHQSQSLHGSTSGERTITIPKRLTIVEDFQEQWGQRMVMAMGNALKELGF